MCLTFLRIILYLSYKMICLGSDNDVSLCRNDTEHFETDINDLIKFDKFETTRNTTSNQDSGCFSSDDKLNSYPILVG